MRARIGAAEDAFRGAGEPQRRRMWCRLRVQALPGRGAVHPGPPPLTLTACLLACAPARPPEREARESGPQEKHRGWFRDARITPLAGARVVRLRQGRTVLEHDGGSQLIEREAKPLRCAASASLLPPGQAIPRREAEGWRVQ